MPRLFIAIPIEKEAKWQLQAALEPLTAYNRTSELRIVEDELWHFTLVFLGNQEENVVERIRRAFQQARFNVTTKVNIICEQCVIVPNSISPRMVWVTLQRESDVILKKIKREVVSIIEHAGVVWDHDTRNGLEHITVVRFEKNIRNETLREISKIEVKGLAIPLDRIALIESTLTPKGPIYTERAFIPIF